MPDVEQQIDSLKAQIAKAESARTRKEVERDQAQAAMEKALKALRDEFEVENAEQARDVLKDLEDERARLIAETEAALEETT